jgi:ketosteroid isomerase-like protein
VGSQDDEHGVGLVKVRASRGGNTMEQNAVHVFHFADGKVTSVWLHNYDQAAGDAFWQ